MVDPTKLNQDLSKKKKTSEHTYLRAFIFSFIGALVGAALTIAIHYFFVRSAISFFLCGMGAYAIYIYFVEGEAKKKRHIFIMLLSALLATIIVTFIDFMLLEPSIQKAEGNIFSNTIEMYAYNIKEVGFTSYIQQSTVEGHTTDELQMSVLLINTINYLFTVIGLMLSWLFVTVSTDRYDKKHGNDSSKGNYGYSTRKPRKKKIK